MIQLACLALPLLLGAPDDPPVIRVGDVALSAGAVTARAEALRKRGVPFSAEQLIEGLIEEAALAAEARRTGLDRDPSVRALVVNTQSGLLARAVEDQLSKAVRPTEERLRSLFHLDADTVRLSLVVVGTRDEALQVLDRLSRGGEFALEATKSMDPTSSRNKGDTGPLKRMLLDAAMAREAFKAPIGALFGPVELSNGWAVARVTERSVGTDGGFREARERLLPMAQQQASVEAREHVLAGLRKKASAYVVDAALEALGTRVEVGPAEAAKTVAGIGDAPIRYYELLPSLRGVAGGRSGGHMLGAPVKKKVAWDLIDARLLAAEGRASGLDRAPAMRIKLAAAEVNALAASYAEKIRAGVKSGASASAREKAVASEIKSLRKRLQVSVDKSAALAAARAGGADEGGRP